MRHVDGPAMPVASDRDFTAFHTAEMSPQVRRAALPLGSAVAPTGPSRHGGCCVTNFEGTKLTCYVGQLAVDDDIVGAGFLGDWVAGPGQG